MTNMNLIVQIAGRDALPVRAIPFVTGWSLAPDTLAKQFAKRVGAPFAGLQNTFAYHMPSGLPVKMLPKEWDKFVADLAALEAALRSKFTDDGQGYAAWRGEAVQELPAGVFVWLDEFLLDFQADFSPEKITLLHERVGDRDLTLTPTLDFTTRSVVMEGFKPPTVVAAHAQCRGSAHAAAQSETDVPVVAELGTKVVAAPVAVVVPEPNPTALNTSDGANSAPTQPAGAKSVPLAGWTLTKPKRFQGYTEPLYLLLEAAFVAGKPRPTARDALQAFAKVQPSQIAKVIEGESLDYYLASGKTKSANLKAIAAAITGMTGKSQDSSGKSQDSSGHFRTRKIESLCASN